MSPTPSPAVARSPYRTSERLWLYVASGVEAEVSGRRVAGSVQLWATDDDDALAQARAVFCDWTDIQVERPLLPAIEPPGWEADDDARAAWSEARAAYQEARDRAFWDELAAREARAAA